MKNARLTNLIILVVVSLMLASCGGTPAPAAQVPATTEAAATTEAPAATEAAATTEAPTTSDAALAPEPDAYNPPIELSTVQQTNATLKYDGADDANNNPWTRAYEKKYGIKVKTLWSVAPEQWEQRVNLMIASGDLPDFFRVDPIQFKQLAEADLIEDLTEAYETHATARVKELLTEGGPQALQSATIDGRLMAIPHTGVPKEGVPVLWVRTDWLQKLNLPEPKTMDDLLKTSEAFTTQDPDGNGQNDTFGLAVDKDLNQFIGFFNGYHAYRGIWTKDDTGKLAYSTIQPEMKTALQQLQAMFKAGQIDREFGVKDFPKVAEGITGGKIGMMFASPYSGLYPLQTAKDNDPKAEWQAYPIVSVDDQPAKLQVAQPGVIGYWVVKKGVEHPEAILKMLAFWIESFYDTTSKEVYAQYNQSETNPGIWTMAAVQAYRAFKNVDLRTQVVTVMNSSDQDMSKLTPEAKDMYAKIMKSKEGDNTNWGWDRIFGEAGSMGVTEQYRENNLYVNDEFITTPLPTMVERSSTLEKLEEETFTKIIQGAPIEEFDNFVAEWKQLGGDAITAEVNEWYASQ